MHSLLPGLHLPRHHPRPRRPHPPLRQPETEVKEVPVSGGGGQTDRLFEQPKMADGGQRELRRRRRRRSGDPHRGSPSGPRAPVGTSPSPRPAYSSLVAAYDSRDPRSDVDGKPDPVGDEAERCEAVRTKGGREMSSRFRRGRRSHTAACGKNSVFDSGTEPQRAPIFLSRPEISYHSAAEPTERRNLMRKSQVSNAPLTE